MKYLLLIIISVLISSCQSMGKIFKYANPTSFEKNMPKVAKLIQENKKKELLALLREEADGDGDGIIEFYGHKNERSINNGIYQIRTSLHKKLIRDIYNHKACIDKQNITQIRSCFAEMAKNNKIQQYSCEYLLCDTKQARDKVAIKDHMSFLCGKTSIQSGNHGSETEHSGNAITNFIYFSGFSINFDSLKGVRGSSVCN